MAISKTTDTLFADIYDGSRIVKRQTELMVGLVTRTQSDGMNPRILPQYTKHTAATVSEGSAQSITTFAKTAQGTVTPAIVAHRIQLTDERIATDPDLAARDAAREAGFAISSKQDADLIGLASSFTSSVGTAGTSATLANAQLAMARLAQANAMGQKYVVLGAGQWLAISKQLTQTANTSFAGMFGSVGDEAMRNFFVGQQLGAAWFIDTNIGTTGTAGTAYGLAFHPEAIIYDERMGGLSFERERIPSQRAWELNWALRYGYGIYRNDHGVNIKTNNAVV